MIQIPDEAEIVVLTGTTAVGKTEISLELAEKINAEILSCDSTNVYRGMDIGTAKPTREEQARIPHHGLDLVEVNETFSVGDYVDYAKKIVQNLRSRGKRVLVSGGSGFYLKSFFAAVTDGVEVPADLRERVREIERQGRAAEVLRELNPAGTQAFDWQNPRRVVRALERCLATGKTIDELRAEMLARPSEFARYKRFCVMLSRERDELNARIERRVAAMLEAGLVAEVERLRERGLSLDVPAGTAIGYKETLAWLDEREQGAGSGEQVLQERIALATRQLAAKQRKWFRTQVKADCVVDL